MKITRIQAEAGVWKPKVDGQMVPDYLKALEQEGEYVHTIWPEPLGARFTTTTALRSNF